MCAMKRKPHFFVPNLNQRHAFHFIDKQRSFLFTFRLILTYQGQLIISQIYLRCSQGSHRKSTFEKVPLPRCDQPSMVNLFTAELSFENLHLNWYQPSYHIVK